MWLYIPTFYHSVPEEVDSTSDSDSLFQALEQSATWKTKSRPAASWSRIWKRNGWTQRLFGLTYSPSMASRGVESWIGSLVGTPVNHSAMLEGDSGPTTHATSGPMLPESSQMSLPGSASSRTSVLICDSDSVKSPETFKAWATRLRQHCLQRRKSALLTAENGSSSWPTARVGGGGSSAMDRSHPSFRGRLEAAAESMNWQTPNAAAEAPNLGSNIKRGPKSLLAQAQWATLSSRDWKDTGGMSVTGTNPDGSQRTRLDQLGRQAPRMPMLGDESLKSAQTSRRRLNPRFVEWLMGWPEGWVELRPLAEVTSSTSSGMA